MTNSKLAHLLVAILLCVSSTAWAQQEDAPAPANNEPVPAESEEASAPEKTPAPEEEDTSKAETPSSDQEPEPPASIDQDPMAAPVEDATRTPKYFKSLLNEPDVSDTTPDAAGESEGAEPEPTDKDAEADEKTLLDHDFLAIQPDDGAYVRFLKKELKRLSAYDLFGNSAQIPAGYFGIKYDWTTTKAASRFDAQGKKAPLMEPLALIKDNGDVVISMDPGVAGTGGGHAFMFSYGIIDDFAWFMEMPFTYMHLSLNPELAVVDDEGNKVRPGPEATAFGIKDTKNYNESDFLYDTMPQLGRATPATEYKGNWLLGDIVMGFGWNYFRSEHLSFGMVGRVIFPTGKLPNPNHNLAYGTGPAIETGLGGWAVGLSQILDVRLFRFAPWIDVVLTTEFATRYAFEQSRKYPTNFEAPNPIAANLDPEAFADLSDLEGSFSYTPGFAVDAMAQLTLALPVINFAFAIGVQHGQEPWLEGDPDFVRMAKALELIGQSTLVSFQVGGTISLLPLFVPMGVGFSYRRAIAGHNGLVLDDYFQLSLMGYIPVRALWD